MIKSLKNCDELTLVIRNMIIEQSELPSDYVLCSETHQGAELGHLVKEYDDNQNLIRSEIVPFETSETFIVFDLSEEPEKAVTQVLDDDSVDCFAHYSIHFVIYGDAAGTVSQKLRARLTTAKVRRTLESNGAHIEAFEPIASLNEFINNIYWQRKDLELKLSCRFNFSQYDTDDNIATMKVLKTEVNEEFARVVDTTLTISRQARVQDNKLIIDADVEVIDNKLVLS